MTSRMLSPRICNELGRMWWNTKQLAGEVRDERVVPHYNCASMMTCILGCLGGWKYLERNNCGNGKRNEKG